ncbi:IS3 family transposase ISCpe6 [bioreactor metagenome]|uniref:IS3 family transposase ISCpe6 n=1 Tax=bioreactor metagenome TaxID=1076179 RepID=A0A645B8I7_9ZZZZ
MYMNGSPQIRYRIIAETIKRDNNLLNISYLCEIAGVSRSGFYYWQNGRNERLVAEEHDQKDFDIILAAFQYRGYDKGARGIHMRLLHQDPPVRMNPKKIRRLMKKFHLFCPVRKVNPYRTLAKRLQENRVAPNILNRQFKAYGPRTVLLTDITYIPRLSHHGAGNAQKYTYVCVIMDAFTKEALACVCSTSCETDFVLDAVEQLMEQHSSELKTDALIHSDQGCQYTSSRFVAILNDYGLRQSMSRRGNCWDNAPQESLFGHMKDEIHVNGSDGHQQVQQKVLDWIDYYNNERYQWSLAKLSPMEYYRFVTTGEYTLPIDCPD